MTSEVDVKLISQSGFNGQKPPSKTNSRSAAGSKIRAIQKIIEGNDSSNPEVEEDPGTDPDAMEDGKAEQTDFVEGNLGDKPLSKGPKSTISWDLMSSHAITQGDSSGFIYALNVAKHVDGIKSEIDLASMKHKYRMHKEEVLQNAVKQFGAELTPEQRFKVDMKLSKGSFAYARNWVQMTFVSDMSFHPDCYSTGDGRFGLVVKTKSWYTKGLLSADFVENLKELSTTHEVARKSFRMKGFASIMVGDNGLHVVKSRGVDLDW